MAGQQASVCRSLLPVDDSMTTRTERKPGPLARAGSTSLNVWVGFTLGLVMSAAIVHTVRLSVEDTSQLRRPYDVAMDKSTGDAWLCAPAVVLRGQLRGAGWITVVVDGDGDQTPSLPADGAYRPDPVCSLRTLGAGKYSVWRSQPPGEGDGYIESGIAPLQTPWQRT